MPRKPRVTTSGRKPGRPFSSVRKSESFYIKRKVLLLTHNHALESGRTRSDIVEKLLEDYFGITDGEALM